MRELCFVSLFPEYFEVMMHHSILGRAVARGALNYRFVQIRDFSRDKHRRVDDAPYGGGPGLVMKAEPLILAIEEGRRLCGGGHVVLMSPHGQRFNQAQAHRLSALSQPLILVCGHYEGIDERVRSYVDEEISIGDFVLTGGELAAMVVGDAVSRLWSGVLGNDASSIDESFSDGWLEYPQYTRPETVRGARVPDVLLNGNHAQIAQWRRCASILRTQERRPDIFDDKRHELTHDERVWLGWEAPKKPQKRRKQTQKKDIQSDGSANEKIDRSPHDE